MPRRRSTAGARSGPTDRVEDAKGRVAANVRRLRADQGLTQEELAEAADLDPRAIQLLESGTGNPRLSSLALVAAALGADLQELVQPAARPNPRRPGRPGKAKGTDRRGRD